MSSNHTQARTRESAAEAWLSGFDPGDGAGPCGDAGDFTRPVVIAAFAAGVDHAEGEHAVERSTGQRQLDDATALMREAAGLFREYEVHHLRRGREGSDNLQETHHRKAQRNGLMASRLEAWLNGDQVYPITADGAYVAHAEFRRPAERMEIEDGGIERHVAVDTPGEDTVVAHGEPVPMIKGETDRLTGPINWSGSHPFADRACDFPGPDPTRLTVPDGPGRITVTLGLTTGDPRFDPTQPVTVNGYIFHPATEA